MNESTRTGSTHRLSPHHALSLCSLTTGSHVSDDDPDTIAREKAKALEGHTPTAIPGAPGWNEKLASDSEAVVKAERAAAEQGVPSAPACPGKDITADVEILVEQTVEFLRQDTFIDRAMEECGPDRKNEAPLMQGHPRPVVDAAQGGGEAGKQEGAE